MRKTGQTILLKGNFVIFSGKNIILCILLTFFLFGPMNPDQTAPLRAV